MTFVLVGLFYYIKCLIVSINVTSKCIVFEL